MRLCLNTDGLGHLPFEEMVKTSAAIGVESLEIACGNWSNAPHIDLDGMLESASLREQYMDVIRKNGLVLEALNCSGNQLEPNETGRAHQEVVEKTFRLAEQLGVHNIVMMSGLPGGNATDTCANWVTTCWPMSCQDMLKYQWVEIIGPQDRIDVIHKHEAFARVLHQHGHKLSDTHILHADYNLKQATQQVLEHIELFQPGTACFAQNDMMALGALEALREQGIQVPDDVALIGSDNIPIGSWFTPHLTTVAVDYDKIINLTVEWVMAMVSNKLPDTYRYILDSKLIIRDTFCPRTEE